MRADFDDMLVPMVRYPWILCKGPNMTPGKKIILKLKRFLSYHDIASIFDSHVN